MSWLASSLRNTLQKLAGRQERFSEPSQPAAPTVPPPEPRRESAKLYWTDDDGESHRRRIEIRGTSPNAMEVFLNQQLPMGLEVRILREDGAPIPGKVQHCTEEPDGYRIELFILRPERRRFEHKPEHQPATLEWSNPSGNEISSEVVVRNSTEEGVQVELTDNVPVPSVVRLCRGDWRQLGLTCYCNSTGDKYRVGIEFTHAPYHKDAAELKD